ncbi:bud site selection protein 4 [Monosporozyma unispora]
METKATLDLLYKELDHSMLENENIQQDGSYISTIEEENVDENKHLLNKLDEDDEVNTQVNADSPLLSSPFKMQQNNHSNITIDHKFEQPVLRKVNIESLSGGTYINHSNKQEKQMSPSSVKLMNILENETSESDIKTKDINEDDDAEENDSLFMEKVRPNTIIPNSFSLESTKPLLAHDNNKSEVGPTPYRLSMISTNGTNDMEDSPQIVRSPAKIPLTNTMDINQFANGPLSESSEEQSETKETEEQALEHTINESNLEIPTTRLSSGSSYTDDKLELSTDKIKDEFNLLSTNISDINHKELEKMQNGKDDISNDTTSNFGKLYNGRMVSIATSIGDYQSAKENQTKSNLVSETSESIADLNISAGIDLADETFQKEIDEEGSLSSINEQTEPSEMVHSKTLENISAHNVTLQKENAEDVTQTSINFEDITKDEVEIEDSFEVPKLNKVTNDKENTTNSEEELILSEVEDIIKQEQLAKEISNTNQEQNVTISETIPKEESFSCKMNPNHLLVESLKMGSSRESSQTLELDVDSIMEKSREKDIKPSVVEEIQQPSDSETQLSTEATPDEIFSSDEINTQEGTTPEVKDEETKSPIEETLKQNIAVQEEVSMLTKEEEKIERQTIRQISNVRIPSIQKEPTLEPKFIDDLFNSESDTSVDSIEQELLKKPDNYLAIWHIQEKKEPALNLQVKGFTSNVSTKQLEKKPIKKFEKVTYSFKPKIIHNPKINYLERNVPIKHDTSRDITTSLSQEFENALKTLTTEPPSRSVSILRRPVNIWTKSEDTSNTEKFQDSKKIVLQEAFGDDFSPDTFKTPGKTPIINKADSIKSFQVDVDYDVISFSPATPIKEDSAEFKLSPRGNGHVGSPFKIIPKRSEARKSANPKKLVQEQEPVIVSNEEIVEENMGAVTPLPEENVTGGILFMNLENITVSLTGTKQRDAQFSLEIDNGVNVTKTEWKSLSSDNMLLLDNELAIPIDGEKQEKLFFTLKCQFRRPKKQLVEVVEKVRVGKSFGGLGKSKYAYEKKFVERKISYDEWDYLFAQDGSFARAELNITDLFLEKAQTFKKTSKTEGMINQWAKLITSANKNERVLANDLPRRSPYVAATFKHKSYFAKRSSSLESFPSTLKNAIAMAQKYKKQQEIKKEGFLVQDGGDLNGMIEKRFFKLHGTELVGYHERSMKPKININLLNVKDITSTLEEKDSNGKAVRNFTNLFLFGECFTLLFNNNESISFNCQLSGKDTREWYSTLKEVIDLNVTHQPWIKKLAQDI